MTKRMCRRLAGREKRPYLWWRVDRTGWRWFYHCRQHGAILWLNVHFEEKQRKRLNEGSWIGMRRRRSCGRRMAEQVERVMGRAMRGWHCERVNRSDGVRQRLSNIIFDI